MKKIKCAICKREMEYQEDSKGGYILVYPCEFCTEEDYIDESEITPDDILPSQDYNK